MVEHVSGGKAPVGLPDSGPRGSVDGIVSPCDRRPSTGQVGSSTFTLERWTEIMLLRFERNPPMP